jgi:signal transduction histidine kinase
MTLFYRSLCLLCIYLLVLHWPASAQTINEDSLRKVIAQHRRDTLRVDALNRLGGYLLSHKQDTSGLALLKEALRDARSLGYYTGICQSLLARGNYATKQNDWLAAIATYEDILQEPFTGKDSLRRIRAQMMAHNNLGGIYNRNGDYTTALSHRLQSLKLAEQQAPDPNTLVIVYCNIASEYRQLQLYDKAAEYLDRVKPMLTDLKPIYHFDYLYELHSLDEVKNDTAGITRALAGMKTLITTAKFSPFQILDTEYEYYKLEGNFFRDYQKDYKKAIKAHQQSLQTAIKMNAEESRLSALQNLATSYYKAGMTNQAIPLFEEVYRLGVARGLTFNAKKAAGHLSDIFKTNGRFELALSYREKAISLSDSLQKDEKLKELNFLEARYQNEKRMAQIASLERENELHKLEVKEKNRWMLASIAIAILVILFSMMLYRSNRQRRLLAEKDRMLKEEEIRFLEGQQKLISLQSMVNGQEAERSRIAKDLHDGLGGLFSTVRMHYSTLQEQVPALQDLALYKKTRELIGVASEELRRVAHNMMPEVLLKLGLPEALRDMSNTISAGGILSVNFQSYGLEKRLDRTTEIMLYRIIQELINNIIKHASASTVLIQLNREENRLSLVVEDNGKGFDTAAADGRQSMGLATIKSRVEYLRGQLVIDSVPDVGTTVLIDIVLDNPSS